ncbi:MULTISPECIES: TIGR02281 family clan AA aspartic protease [unclassified Methylophaga]|jgi:aspartyl protease family protein|uniref:retropepsin-like aspartic protease family protein n=1 Tax=unclassified Methylophaga TaxID=2629249 RepID=UPI000C8C30E7|nr:MULTISPECIES: TIGR02281 family clan AA aspartic protease [unclassified Methylophaga]MAK66581.1 TIGR02281 family clan AA aspartic protease [Methylophaga sp.]MAY17540.1 TIGR02281 family clan AA aspartic protease [Methylophaga sp.]MBN47483.1 TIGR02281 family clan AA aspartic protease [Methylophaga sp.]HAO24975.1 TIGR02281 family clan AA aspartic protease [Methylophaga sp.]HCD06083.1 TIGR02281 family clan AA aspartic protease [Methylophaga sp.]|tara:strand:+ start:31449 stop:31973 length:525 start_codon:yes stop_codon:yes gene_type:complete
MKMNPAHQQGSSKAFTIIFWLLLMGSLTLFFNGFIEQKHNPNRHLVEMDAGLGSDVVLLRNQAGHYVAPGFINGHEVTFLLDTGATNISVPAGIARKAGLKQGRQAMVNTANGVVPVYATELETVQLGAIKLQHIRAHINPHMSDDIVLLGMSFMKHLDMTQREGTLTLRLPNV